MSVSFFIARNAEEEDMEREEKIKVVLLEPGKLAKVVEIDYTLENMQRLVGDGLIEPCYYFREQVCLVCNDEGKINGMSLNRAIYNDNKQLIDIVAGPAFICGINGPNFCSLSDEQIKRYKKQFRYPEVFFRNEKGIVAMPYNPDRGKER